MAKRLEVVVMSGEMAGKRFAVPDGGLRMGRSSSNDLHIPDEELSRNHCLFEPDGEEGIRVIDLASANGTFVNGEALGSAPRVLKAGDRIEVGSSLLTVAGEGAPAPEPPGEQHKAPPPPVAGGAVDLGLGSAAGPGAATGSPSAQGAAAPEPAGRRVLNLIWAGAATALVAAILFLLFSESKSGGLVKSVSRGLGIEQPSVREAAPAPATEPPFGLLYERVDATPGKVERYFASVELDKVTLSYDAQTADGAGLQRLRREEPVSETTRAQLARLFDSDAWLGAKSASGADATEANALRSWRIRAMRGGEVREVRYSNVPVPAPVREICGQIEVCVNNDLGVSPSLRSREECVAESRRAEALGDELTAGESLKDDNLWNAVRNYRNAYAALDGLQDCLEDQIRVQGKVESSETRLAARYKALNDRATMAAGQRDIEAAISVYREIRALIPDETDPRGADAIHRLRDLESRLEEIRKGKRK